jgi:SAM-dependent methyltransferase
MAPAAGTGHDDAGDWIPMKRILEPELMTDEEQARAYADADFEEAHNGFVEHLKRTFAGMAIGPSVLDLGCGPGDISIRVAQAHPNCVVHGVDGSKAMLKYSGTLLDRVPAVRSRVQLVHGMLPGAQLPKPVYDTLISNSLLHHLPDPQILWQAVRTYAVSGAPVFVMDLIRPDSIETAERLVAAYVADEPEVLQRDFYNSLLAAFEIDEVRDQLSDAGLYGFSVEPITDRHMIVSGRAP